MTLTPWRSIYTGTFSPSTLQAPTAAPTRSPGQAQLFFGGQGQGERPPQTANLISCLVYAQAICQFAKPKVYANFPSIFAHFPRFSFHILHTQLPE